MSLQEKLDKRKADLEAQKKSLPSFWFLTGWILPSN
jgi:hypothetical protein